jgi:hypothetical protein
LFGIGAYPPTGAKFLDEAGVEVFEDNYEALFSPSA